MKILKLMPLLGALALPASLQALEQDCNFEYDPGDPLMIDLDQNGFHFGERGVGVEFDLLGNGVPIKMQWVAQGQKDAFLAVDRNNNGIVDNGSELFGNGTVMELENDLLAPNGFMALAQYDLPMLGGNNDGILTVEDSIWTQLVLWHDADADGVSTEQEMLPLTEFGIEKFEIYPRTNERRDGAGNWIPFWNWAKADRSKYKMVNVYFRFLN